MKILSLFSILLFQINCSVYNDGGGVSNIENLSIKLKAQAQEDVSLQIQLIKLIEKETSMRDFKVISLEGQNSALEVFNGDVIYKSHPHYFGKDIVKVVIINNDDFKVSQLILEVDVAPTEDAPISFDDDIEALNGQVVVDVLRNDIDVDGDSLEIISVEESDDLEVEIVDNKIVLTPESGFDTSLDRSIAYTIADSKGEQSVAYIRVNDNLETNTIGLNIVFIGSSSESKVGACESKGEFVKDTLNDRLRIESQSMIKVHLNKCQDDIIDDAIYVHCDPREAQCNDFDKILTNYSEPENITLVFVNDIQGPVAGIAKINQTSHSRQAAVVAEERSIARGGNVYTHELGHLFGLDHTQQVGLDQNKWIAYGSCGQSFSYFQRGYEFSLSSQEGFSDSSGVLWEDHLNFMKSELSSSGEDLTFFSKGYESIFSKIFSCFRSRSI